MLKILKKSFEMITSFTIAIKTSENCGLYSKKWQASDEENIVLTL